MEESCDFLMKVIQACQQGVSNCQQSNDQIAQPLNPIQQAASTPLLQQNPVQMSIPSSSPESSTPVVPLGLQSLPLREPGVGPGISLSLLGLKPENIKAEQNNFLANLGIDPNFLATLQNGPKGLPMGVHSSSTSHQTSKDTYNASKLTVQPSQSNGFVNLAQNQEELDCDQKSSQSSAYGNPRKVTVCLLDYCV